MERIDSVFFAVATAIWFGLMAYRAGRAWYGWALGGAIFALVASTIVFGVTQATFLPLSHTAYVHWRVRSVAIAFLVIFILGWILTLSLRRKSPAPTPDKAAP